MGGESNADAISHTFRFSESKQWFLFVTVLAVEVWVCSYYLPPLFSFEGSIFSKERPDKRRDTTDLEQPIKKRTVSENAALAAHYSLMLIAYILKRAILRLPIKISILFYSWMVMLSLPYVWFFEVNLWHHPFVYRIVGWVVFPVIAWIIPTASFLFDRLSGRKVSLIGYVIRSVVEQSVLHPIIVFFISFLCICLDWIVV